MLYIRSVDKAAKQRIMLQPCLFQKQQNLTNKKLTSKLFVRHSSGDKRRKERKKILIDFVIKLNENDGLFKKGVTTCDQRKSF